MLELLLGNIKSNDLIYENLIRRLSLEPSEDVSANHSIIVRFQQYQKALLQEISGEYSTAGSLIDASKSSHIQHEDLDLVVTHLLYRWSWGANVLRQLLTEFNPEVVEDFHDGSQKKAFNQAIMWLASKPNDLCYDRQDERARQLVDDNGDFIRQLGSINPQKIDIITHPDDENFSRSLALIFLNNVMEMSTWKGFRVVAGYFGEDNNSDDEPAVDQTRDETAMQNGESTPADILRDVESLIDIEDTWDVWRFCRMFGRFKHRSQNSSQLADLTSTATFTQHWQKLETNYLNWR